MTNQTAAELNLQLDAERERDLQSTFNLGADAAKHGWPRTANQGTDKMSRRAWEMGWDSVSEESKAHGRFKAENAPY